MITEVDISDLFTYPFRKLTYEFPKVDAVIRILMVLPRMRVGLLHSLSLATCWTMDISAE